MQLRRLALVCLALGALLPALAAAAALPLETRITAETTLIIHANGRQQFITSLDLTAAGPRSGLLFPVPGAAEADQPAIGAQLLAYLAEATRPTPEEVQRVIWDAEALPAPTPAALPEQAILGGYELVSLGSDPQELERWLEAHDYTLPAAARPILAAYLAEGWTFVAVRLAPGMASGALAPLRLSFAADRIVYPIRLGALANEPRALDLYVLTEGRVALDPLETRYAGPVALLDPAPPASLAPLLATAPYLTRLSADALDPRQISADLVARPVPGDQPFRAVETVYVDVTPSQAYGLPAALLCLTVISIGSVVISLAFRRYFDSISPDKK